MAKKRKSETAPAASPLVRTGSGLADTGPRQSGMAPTSRPYYRLRFVRRWYDDIDLQHAIAQEHWYVCGYKMNMK